MYNPHNILCHNILLIMPLSNQLKTLMLTSISSITTRVCNELEVSERGIRHWSMAEIEGQSWFQIEICLDDTPPSIRSCIVPNFEVAQSQIKAVRDASWIDLRMYARLPMLSAKGFILESIQHVYRTNEGTHVFALKSGLMIYESQQNSTARPSLENAKQVYSKRWPYP